MDPRFGDNFGGKPFSAIESTATVGLASIGEGENDLSERLIWAVDDAWIEEVVVDPSTKFLKIHAKLATAGQYAGIGRLNYRAYVLAIA